MQLDMCINLCMMELDMWMNLCMEPVMELDRYKSVYDEYVFEYVFESVINYVYESGI
jgi:hypothetical protein